jgi:uncharacterized membrane protein YdjX (TVP38/TMEM64 family)
MHPFSQTVYNSLKKWFLLGLLGVMLSLFFYFHLNRYLTFETIQTYLADVQQWTELHYRSAVTIYILFFILMIACAIPGATILTLLGGFLFGISAFIYAIMGTTLGGLVLFLAIRTAIGAGIAAKSSGWIKKMEAGFQENAFHYILTLRLMPVFPCWISNIAAGALNVPIRTFIVATVLGIAPATFIYVMAGRSLDRFLLAEKAPTLAMMLTPSVFLPLLGLAILSLFPVIYKYLKKTDAESNDTDAVN